jgi:hypothetical protein
MAEKFKPSGADHAEGSKFQSAGAAPSGAGRVGTHNMAQRAQILKPIFPGRRGDIARTAVRLYEAEITTAILGNR